MLRNGYLEIIGNSLIANSLCCIKHQKCYDILLQAIFPFCCCKKFFKRKFSAERRSGSFSTIAMVKDLAFSSNGRSCTMLASLKFSMPLCLVPSISPGPLSSISFSAISKPLFVTVSIFIRSRASFPRLDPVSRIQ